MFLKGKRKKWFIPLVLMAIIIALGLYFVLALVTRKNFSDLEIKTVERGNHRAQAILQNVIDSMKAQVGDWAHWDAPWEMMANPQTVETFYAENLSSDALGTLRVNLICFFDISKKVVLAKGVSLPEAQDDPEAVSKCNEISKIDKLFDLEMLQSYNEGYVDIGLEVPLTVVSSNIIRSDATGPSHGYAVFALEIDARMLDSVARMGMFPVETTVTGHSYPSNDYKNAESAFLRGANGFISIKDDDTIYGYIPFRDFANNLLAIMRTKMPRDIYAQGERVVDYFRIIAISIGLLVVAIVALMAMLIEASKGREDAVRVKARSKELEEINKIMIGRELQMVELKKQAAKMKHELTRKKTKSTR